MPRLGLLIALLLTVIIGLLEAFTALLLDTWRHSGWRNTHPSGLAPKGTP